MLNLKDEKKVSQELQFSIKLNLEVGTSLMIFLLSFLHNKFGLYHNIFHSMNFFCHD